ncbi:D-aminoacyl-tRNA deacylase [Natrarchaeobaculum sulfurireducens]|uniref:D-aminoacyl-tRNA deacylase n=1 Tax=Natrarchaeobaculum sulfurireducens TaxID=2044521 RepID=A0A346PIJ1_9EURY|nr:D-aminoacyl-tRNA deacylase [Natrarchaeobaculum sulfurireducens]AXR79336.1 Ribonuclease Z, beta-lactamase superfamily hydrolase [Natrarchaeobaculum sulfurireducens]AXR83109.1 D-aminoacyl-tRNA deacylase [Natrarchaeobaculum sulfurireducens]
MTELAIVESRADRASVHVCEHLRTLLDWEERVDAERPDADGGGTYFRADGVELRSFEPFHLELERPAAAFDCDPDLLVFASRHSGDTGPLLTGHFTGNVGPAEFGGAAYAVAEAAPNALARLLVAFDEYAPAAYDVGMECTHHGPTDVGCPSLFAELGSDDEQWDDPAGAEAVARSILELRDVSPHRERAVVGFGGNHYAPRFERIVRETPWAVGHIAADWGLESLDHPGAHERLLEALFEASGTELAVIDGEWPVLEATLDELGYRVVSETWLRTVGDRPLDLVDLVESTLGDVDDGVRFGERMDRSVTVCDLPTDLIGTAEGIDPEAVRAAVAASSVAFETDNGGSRIGSQAAFPDPAGDAYDDLVATLAALLERTYEAVVLEADAVVAEKMAFDPTLAREAGVPEGPKFGTLADGEPVTVDGTRIDPDRVRTRRTHRFEI